MPGAGAGREPNRSASPARSPKSPRRPRGCGSLFQPRERSRLGRERTPQRHIGGPRAPSTPADSAWPRPTSRCLLAAPPAAAARGLRGPAARPRTARRLRSRPAERSVLHSSGRKVFRNADCTVAGAMEEDRGGAHGNRGEYGKVKNALSRHPEKSWLRGEWSVYYSDFRLLGDGYVTDLDA